MANLPQKPSLEALEMLAKLMILRAERESPERFAKLVDNKFVNKSVRLAKQLSLTLIMRADD